MIALHTSQVDTRVGPLVCLIGLLGLVGCTNVPKLDATIPNHLRDADYPKLIRLDQEFSMAQNPRQQAEDIEKSLEARRRRLQSKARQLQDSPN